MGIAAQLLVTWFSDKKGERVKIFLTAQGVEVVGYLTIFLTFVFDAPFAVKFVALSLPRVAGPCMWPVRVSYMSDILPKEIAAAGFSFMNAAQSSGGFFGPLMIGGLRRSTGTYVIPLAVAAALFGAGFLAHTFLLLPCIRRRGSSSRVVALPPEDGESEEDALV